MALTVTATQSGPSSNAGTYLLVRVLTNALESGGATAGRDVTAPNVSLTPNFSNSYLVFSVSEDNDSAVMGAAATNNTYDYNNNNAAHVWSTAQGHYTGTVTSGSAVTLGTAAASGTGDHWNACGYEIQASGGTVTVDGSSPAGVNTPSGLTITTASFTPPAGSVIVAQVCAGGSGSGAGITMTMTSTGGLQWTQRAVSSSSDNFQPTWVFTATMPFPPAPPASGRARPGRTWARRFRNQQPPWIVPDAPPLPGPAGNQPGGRVVWRRGARSIWGGVLGQPGLPLVSGEAPPHLVIARRSSARAVVGMTRTATTNAVVVTGVSGTAPDHLVVARRQSARAVWRGAAVPPQPSRVVTDGVAARRQPARAVWRPTLTETTNLRYGNQPGGVIKRRTAARGVYGGHAVPPQSSVPVTDGLVRRRQPARAVWHGFVSATVNATPAGPVTGTTPDHLVVARRAAARAVWRGFVSTTTNLRYGNQPGTGLVRRRQPARAVWAGTTVRTTNATPATPINGTAPDHLVIGRRTTTRVVWSGTVTRTTNNVPVAGAAPGHLVVARRQAARGYWRGNPVAPRTGRPATGGLTRRRRPAGGQWRGYLSRTTNAPPPVFQVARSTPTVADPRDGTATVTQQVT